MARAIQELDAFTVPLADTRLVEASAGTGKTHTITSLFLRLVLEKGHGVREILVVTFTEAAMTELRDRIRRRLRVAVDVLGGRAGASDPELAAFASRAPDRARYLERAVQALRDLDLAAISTIHSFCQNMLREHAFESGARYGLELMPDTRVLVGDIADDYWAHRVYDLSPSLFALRNKKFELDTARSLVGTFARRPNDTTVLPDRVAAPSDVAMRAAWTRARAAWRKSGKAIRALLHESDALHRRTFSTTAIDDQSDALDAWFADLEPIRKVPSDALDLFIPERLVAATNKGKTTPTHPTFALLDALRGEIRALEGDLIVSLRRDAVEWVRAQLPARKEALRVQGFEDLLFSLDAALRGPRAPELRARIGERFRAALIDEFQDTDPVQYRIFHALFHGHGSLLLVGDPKQSIYAFRGADVFSYANAKGIAKETYSLAHNRRSDPSLVKAVNTLFQRANNAFMRDDIGFAPVAAHEAADRITLPRGRKAFEVLFLPRQGDKGTNKGWAGTHLPRLIAAEIAAFLRSGATLRGERVRPGDIAVLTRTNAQARMTQAELRKLRIPTALQSEESVFESAESADVQLLLRAILEPTRSGVVRSALSTVVAGRGASELATLQDDERAWEHWSETFRNWHTHWTDHGFIQAYRRMLTELGVEKRLLALVDGERRITNLLHLGELLHGVEARDKLGPTALVRWLRLTCTEAAKDDARGTEAGELRLESDAHAVQLLTIHKSKGLEFPVVYCPFLYDVRLPKDSDDAIDFHDPADGLTLKIDVVPHKGSPSLVAKAEEVRAENQRLLYVALTRAKHRCSIVWGAVNQAEDCALAYTLHAGPDRYKGLDDDGLRADLAALAKASGGTIGVVDLPLEPAVVPWEPEAEVAVNLGARTFARTRLDTWFRVGSFSALAKRDKDEAVAIGPEAAGVDHDEADEREGAEVEAAAGPAEPVILHAFPRGAKAGTMLHAVLENHDFADPDDGALHGLAKRKLEEAGYSSAEHADVLVRGLRAMFEAPLDEGGRLKLASITRPMRIDELEFVFPVAHDASVVTANAIADAFEAYPGGTMPASYAERLRLLRFLPLRGFLKGFIDLVFEHEGRFYVVDYKSNHLGPSPDDYGPHPLAHAMAHHDYYLQYHLYVLAVHRWLGRRLRGYDFEKHFGGVYYLFARGMSPAHPGRGVYFDRPSLARVEELSRALGGHP